MDRTSKFSPAEEALIAAANGALIRGDADPRLPPVKL
jgi:hypothetical protein